MGILFRKMIAIITFLLTNHGLVDSCTNGWATFQYKIQECANDLTLLRRCVLQVAPHPTETACAYACYLNLDCRHAIFTRGQFESCYLMSNSESAIDSRLSYLGSCNVLKIKMRCRNGGVPGVYSCTCQSGYHGQYCEERTSSFCEKNDWTGIGIVRWTNVNFTAFHLKLVIQPSIEFQGTKILTLDNFQLFGTRLNKISEFNNQLAINLEHEEFQVPLILAFGYVGNGGKILTIDRCSLDGDLLPSLSENHDMEIVMEGFDNANRLTDQFSSDKIPISTIISGLAKGHRLVHRVPIRVKYHVQSQDVLFDSLYEIADLTTDPDKKLFYLAERQSFKTPTHSYASYIVGTGRLAYTYSEMENHHLGAVDDCWYHMQERVDRCGYDEFTGILRETLLRGQEVRILLNNDISSDVLSVEMTVNDVAAILAPYLIPFTSSGRNDGGTAVYSIASRRGVLASCGMTFQAGQGINKTVENPNSIRWILSQRKWIRILLVDGHGSIMFGSRDQVRAYARDNRANIRVCVEYTDSKISCFGGKSIFVKETGDGDVLLQSMSVVTPLWDSDGILKGVGKDNCRREERLVSTGGWMKAVWYVEGNTDFELDNNVLFKQMIWFAKV